MRESRSATFKMILEQANKDRQIQSFIAAYKEDTTPYQETDFSTVVKEACRSRSSVSSCLRISKVIFIGDVAVGKSCIVNRFCHESFDTNYKATIGVDFEVERFDILNVPFGLQIWDTAGQERFKAIASSYYRGAHAIVVVFDLTSIRSLSNTSQWLQEAKKVNSGDPRIYLVGTKRDLMSSSAYKEVEKHAKRMATNLKAEFWAVSSNTGEGINELFLRIACLAFEDAIKREESSRNGMITVGSNLDALSKSQALVVNKTKLRCNSCSI